MDITLDVRKFDESYTTIFVGKNGTGKTNLLQAIGFLAESDGEYNFQALKNIQNDSSEPINFYYTFNFDEADDWKNTLENKIIAPKEFFEKINIKGIEKNVYLTNDSNKFKSKTKFIIENSDNFIQKFYYKPLANNSKLYELISEKEINKTDNSREYKKLLYMELDTILNIVFGDIIGQKSAIVVSKWKFSKENLITDIIDLNEFKENCEICHPLKNIFNLAGFENQEEIKHVIEALNISPKNINKLEKLLEIAAKDHLRTVWPESKVMFKIKIQNDLNLAVYVVDEGNEEDSFYLTDRSEGFKQFISMIIGMSAANATDNLKNRVLIIDEPENHMHPSSITYMRDELLRIGRNNYIFLATHSEHIIDTKNKERHYILTKVNNNTRVKNWESYEDLPEDEVLRQAFGLDILTEALKQYKPPLTETPEAHIYNRALKVLFPYDKSQSTENMRSSIRRNSHQGSYVFKTVKNKVTNTIKKLSSKINIQEIKDAVLKK